MMCKPIATLMLALATLGVLAWSGACGPVENGAGGGSVGGGTTGPSDGGTSDPSDDDTGGTDSTDQTPGDSTDGGDNGGGTAAFSISIAQDPSESRATVGDVFMLSAITRGDLPDPQYAWDVSPPGSATLSELSGATVELTLDEPGTVTVSLLVTDGISGVAVEAGVNLTVETAPEPPEDAVVEIIPSAPVAAGEFVSLVATFGGTEPDSIAWIPDESNVVSGLELMFTDQGNGVATLVIPVTLNFVTELRFTLVVTYANGATLSDEQVLLVL